MVIYLTCEEDHKEHIWKVLEALIEASLYCKLSKYIFSICKIDFLRYIVNIDRVAIEKLWVLTI